MGIKCKIVSEHRVVVVVHVGHTSDEEMLSFYKGLREDARIEKEYSFLIDFTAAASELRSSDAVQRFAGFGEQWKIDRHASAKVAVIAPRDIAYGLARMYQAHANAPDEHHQVFRDSKRAVEWLGVPMSVLEETRDNADFDQSSA